VPTTQSVIDKAKGQAPPAMPPPADRRALFVWGTLLDFEPYMKESPEEQQYEAGRGSCGGSDDSVVEGLKRDSTQK
jgi:hypothetical protein